MNMNFYSFRIIVEMQEDEKSDGITKPNADLKGRFPTTNMAWPQIGAVS